MDNIKKMQSTLIVTEFARVAASEDALNAYNVNRFKGKGKSGYR